MNLPLFDQGSATCLKSFPIDGCPTEISSRRFKNDSSTSLEEINPKGIKYEESSFDETSISDNDDDSTSSDLWNPKKKRPLHDEDEDRGTSFGGILQRSILSTNAFNRQDYSTNDTNQEAFEGEELLLCGSVRSSSHPSAVREEVDFTTSTAGNDIPSSPIVTTSLTNVKNEREVLSGAERNDASSSKSLQKKNKRFFSVESNISGEKEFDETINKEHDVRQAKKLSEIVEKFVISSEVETAIEIAKVQKQETRNVAKSFKEEDDNLYGNCNSLETKPSCQLTELDSFATKQEKPDCLNTNDDTKSKTAQYDHIQDENQNEMEQNRRLLQSTFTVTISKELETSKLQEKHVCKHQCGVQKPAKESSKDMYTEKAHEDGRLLEDKKNNFEEKLNEGNTKSAVQEELNNMKAGFKNKHLNAIQDKVLNTENCFPQMTQAQKKAKDEKTILETEVDLLKNDISDLEEESKDICVRNASKRENTSSILKDCNEISKVKFDEMTKELITSQKKLHMKDEFVRELQQRVASLTSEKSNAFKQLKQKSVQVAKLESTIKVKTEMERKLHDIVKTLEANEKEMEQRLYTLTTEKDRITKQLQLTKRHDKDTFKEINDSLKQKNEQLEIELMEHLSKKEHWCDQEKKLNKTIAQLEQMKKILSAENKSFQEKLEQMEEEATNFLQQNVNLKRKVKTLENESVSAKERIENLEIVASELKTSNAKLEQKERKLGNEAVTYLETINKLEELLRDDQKQSKECLQAVKPLQDRIASLKTDKDALNHPHKETKKSIETIIEELEKDISERIEVETNLKKEKCTLESKVEDLQKSLLEVQTNYAKLTTEYSDSKETLDTKLKEMESKLSDEVEAQRRNENEQTIAHLSDHSCLFTTDIENSDSEVFEAEKKWSDELKMGEIIWSKQEKHFQEKIDELQKRVSGLSNENETLILKLKYKEQIESSERKVITLEKKFTDGYNTAEKCLHIQQCHMDDKIKALHDRIAALDSEKEMLECTYKKHIKSLEGEVFELEQKNSNQCLDFGRKVREQENELQHKVLQLQQRIRELTTHNNELDKAIKDQVEKLERTEIKQQQTKSTQRMAVEKKWSHDMKDMEIKIEDLSDKALALTRENDDLADETLSLKREKVDLARQLTNTKYVYEDKIADLKQQLNDKNDSERDLYNIVQDMEMKISDQDVVVSKLEDEKSYLCNKLKETKSLMRKGDDFKQKASQKMSSMSKEISKLQVEKRELCRCIQQTTRIIDEFPADNGFSITSSKHNGDFSLRLDEEEKLNICIEKGANSDEHDKTVEAIPESVSLLKTSGSNNQEACNLKKEDNGKEIAKEVDDTNLDFLRRDLHRLQASVYMTLKKALYKEKKAQGIILKSNKKLIEEHDKLEKLEEESECLRTDLDASNAHLKAVVKEAKNAQTRSLEIVELLEKQKQEAWTQLDKLREAMDELKEDIDDKNATEKHLKEQVACLKKEEQNCTQVAEENKKQLLKTINQLKTQICKLERSLELKQNVEKEFEKEVEQLEKNLEAERKRVSEYRRCEKDLEEKVKNALERISELEESNKTAQEKIDEISADKDNIKETMKRKLDSEKQEKNKIIAKKNELEMTIDSLSSQIHTLEREKDVMSQRNSERINCLEEDLKREKTKAADYQVRLDADKSTIHTLEQTNEKLLEENKSLNDTIVKQKESLSEITEHLERKKKINKKLEARLKIAETMIESHLDNQEINGKSRAKADCQKTKVNIERDISKLELQLESTVVTKQSEDKVDPYFIKLKLKTIKTKVAALQDQIEDEVDEKKEKIRGLNFKLNAQEDKINELQQEIKHRYRKEESLMKEIHMLTEERDNVTEKIRELRMENTNLTIENMSARHEITHLQSRLSRVTIEKMNMCRNRASPVSRDVFHGARVSTRNSSVRRVGPDNPMVDNYQNDLLIQNFMSSIIHRTFHM